VKAESAVATFPTALFASLEHGWGVVLDESDGWVIGYSHFGPRVCGRYHPLAWPLRAHSGGGFRADGALAFAVTCAFVGFAMPPTAPTTQMPRRMLLVIRPDGSHALEDDAEPIGATG